MPYFFNRRPRGFHYTPRFSNERRDILDSLRRGVSPEQLAHQSAEEAAAYQRHRCRASVLPGCIIALAVVPVSYTHLTLPTIPFECRSRWSPYH